MAFKSTLAQWAANMVAPQIYREHQDALSIQQRLLKQLLQKAAGTRFGRQHSFSVVKTHADYCRAVPARDYEGFSDYINLIAEGEKNVLWPGLPLYFCKTSGTTSGTKYIPVTSEQIAEMIRAARNSLLLYVAETKRSRFFDGKMIFLQGSPELDRHGVIPAGRLSGIVYHHVPFYVNANRMPSYRVNCIEDWEEKVAAIARETLKENMTLISGIPPWVVMYFEKLQELTGKEFIKDIFPHFEVFAYGGVNYAPYRSKIERLIGGPTDSVETYPASEGFIAYQDSQKEQGLLLNINGGIFYEFVKAEDAHRPDAERITLADVETGVNYALLLTTNAGLWSYAIGDTVRFVSKNPYRILVTGRVKHFISAFGEHVIAEEVDFALMHAMRDMQAGVTEYTVAPQVNPPDGGLPYHEWFIEFSHLPRSLHHFAGLLDEYMQSKNIYYSDLRKGHILQELKVHAMPPGTFVNFMKMRGKLGGQNKVPRLTNDRTIADELLALLPK